MKRILAITLTLIMVLAALTGCVASRNPLGNEAGKEGEQNSSGSRLPITLTIAETEPSCPAFEDDCFYAFDAEKTLYRVLWTNLEGLNEKDSIIVEYSNIEKLNIPADITGGFHAKYEITANNIRLTEMASCISDEDGAYILTLPKSKQRITLRDEQRLFVPYITDSLVEAAENKITEDISQYSNNSGFYLQVTDDYLCLTVEVIKYLDEPDENAGCFDHKHLFFSERITLCPVYTQNDTYPENTKEPVTYEQPYVLIYTETYEVQQDGGKTTTVERMIRLSFKDFENATLSLLEVSVNELRVLE